MNVESCLRAAPANFVLLLTAGKVEMNCSIKVILFRANSYAYCLRSRQLYIGFREKIWTARASSGLYFYQLEAIPVHNPSGQLVDVKKMLFLK